MSAARQQSAPAPTAATAEELAADLVKLGTRKALAARLARAAVFSTEGPLFALAHVLRHAPKTIEATRIVRLMQKHGVLPEPRGRA